MPGEHSWLDDVGRVVSVGLSLLLATVLIRQSFGINVWQVLADWLKRWQARAAELAQLRKMWGQDG